jgi:DNA-binding response OmpR family regulator
MSMTSSSTTTLNRKVIHQAGVLIVQPDSDLATSWRDALLDYGMSGVHVVGTADEAVASIRVRRPSGIVVALPSQVESHELMARLMAGESGQVDDIPAILVMPRPTRASIIAAAGVGFDAVLPFPLAPRLIYRRMGSVMQKARRNVRLKQSPHLSLADVMGNEAGPGAN